MKKRMIAGLLALGLLAGCAPQRPSEAASSPAASGDKYEQVTLYLPNETADGLNETSARVEVADPDSRTGLAGDIVQALETERALPEGSAVEDVKTGKAADGEGESLTVDLNQAFADGLQNCGTAGETMILASLVNTLWAYYEPAELYLTVDGKALETGHNIYEEPFTGPFQFD